MSANAWAVIGSLLTIAIGLWKYFTSKAEAVKKRQQAGADKVKEGLANGDTSQISAGFSDINNK